MPFGGDPLAFYGKRIIEDYHASLTAKLPKPDTPPKKNSLILDSLDIEFEILEASDHVGGRLSTYQFPKGQKYDYYDAGAMRYPLPKMDDKGRYKNGIMKRLAELIIYPPLNQGSDRLKDKLIPYYFKAREGPNLKPGFYYFNSVRERISDTPGPFRAEELGVTSKYIKAGSADIHTDVITPFSKMLIEDMGQETKEGWRMMMENDSYSLRAYMAFKYMPSVHLNLPPQHLDHTVINWCELLQSSTKWCDRALTEDVFESLAFAKVGGTDFGEVDWQCFEGGSQVLTTKMADVVNQKGEQILFDKRVTGISQGATLIIIIPFEFPEDKLPPKATVVKSDPQAGTKTIAIPKGGVEVTVHKESTRHVYSHVFSTIPLPVLRTIDMTDAGLNLKQQNALRQFEYGPSVKIAIHFKEPWWTTKLNIVGGQSFTDLPIRTIVYPSYSVDSDTPSTVLIASYCWTTDAERLGSLAVLDKREVLKELVLRNLAEAHGSPITYEFLRDQFVDIDVKDWSHDAHTMGAFAFFGPDDFREMYTSLTYPAAEKRLHFAGEAISTRHAWVIGALDSAWRAVYEYLLVTEQDDKMKKFTKLWGNNVEWTSPPAGLPVRTSPPARLPMRTSPPAEFPDDKSNLLVEHLGLIQEAISGGEIKYLSKNATEGVVM
ncbi:flavin-containing amine oxidoreductase-domain containing protein [Pisolithus microcarpus]|nr:flavin-containing amine oxidoreductase-domain containing protein [Pisolithus microcarpus]